MKLRTFTLSALLALGVSLPAISSENCIGAMDENGYQVFWMRGPVVKFSTEVRQASVAVNQAKYLQVLGNFVTEYSNNGLTDVELSNLVSLVESICRADEPEENFGRLLAKLGLIERIHSLAAEIDDNGATALWHLMPLANGGFDLLESKLSGLITKLGQKLRERVLNSELQRFQDTYGETVDPGIHGREGKWDATADALYYVMTLNSSIYEGLQRAADELSEVFVETGGVNWLRDPKFFTNQRRVLGCLENLGLAYFIHENSLKTEVHKDLASMMVIPNDAQLRHRDFEVEQRKKVILAKLADAGEKRYISALVDLKHMMRTTTPEPVRDSAAAVVKSDTVSEANNNNETPVMIAADYSKPTPDGFEVVTVPPAERQTEASDGTLKIKLDEDALDEILTVQKAELTSDLQNINAEIDKALIETPVSAIDNSGLDASKGEDHAPVEDVTPAAELKRILEDLKEPAAAQENTSKDDDEREQTSDQMNASDTKNHVQDTEKVVEGEQTDQAVEKPSKGQKALAALKKATDVVFKPKKDKKDKRKSVQLSSDSDK